MGQRFLMLLFAAPVINRTMTFGSGGTLNDFGFRGERSRMEIPY